MSYYDIYGRLIPYCFLDLDFRTNSMDPPSHRAYGKFLEKDSGNIEEDIPRSKNIIYPFLKDDFDDF